MKQFDIDISWVATDIHAYQIHGGMTLSVEDGVPIQNLEEKIFEVISEYQQELKSLDVKIDLPNGSKRLLGYEKRGPVWVRLYAEALLPHWFGFITMGIFAIALIILGIIFIFNG